MDREHNDPAQGLVSCHIAKLDEQRTQERLIQ